jgi:protein-S-isoprenylcysteine O-methyltransferase Ste14
VATGGTQACSGQREAMLKKLMPTTYLLISLGARLAPRLVYPGTRIIPPPWNLVGTLPVVLGVWINLAADKAIHTAGTTVKPFGAPTVLVTDGAYGISRNRMYLGFVAILIGVAVLLCTWAPVVIVIVFVVRVGRAFIRAEEQNLENRFGSAWMEYRHSVGHWI